MLRLVLLSGLVSVFSSLDLRLYYCYLLYGKHQSSISSALNSIQSSSQDPSASPKSLALKFTITLFSQCLSRLEGESEKGLYSRFKAVISEAEDSRVGDFFDLEAAAAAELLARELSEPEQALAVKLAEIEGIPRETINEEFQRLFDRYGKVAGVGDALEKLTGREGLAEVLAAVGVVWLIVALGVMLSCFLGNKKLPKGFVEKLKTLDQAIKRKEEEVKRKAID